MNSAPLVSIIIPCYQAEKYVREAIQSVLAQSYKNFEIIAIDDGSTDHTLSILKEYAGLVTALQHPGEVNLGVSLTRKLGIDHAKGKYIAFLDADDCFEPGKIAAQVDALENNSDAVLCHTAIKLISTNGKYYDFESLFNYSKKIELYDLRKTKWYINSNRICNSSVVVSADKIKSIIFYGRQMFQHEDWLTWILTAEHGSFIYLPNKYTKYRLHENSSTEKVLSNQMIKLYSKIELYTSIISRSISIRADKECAFQLLKALDSLQYVYYSENQKNISISKSKLIPFFFASLKYLLYKNSYINKLYCIFRGYDK